jgi:hypothetical protein
MNKKYIAVRKTNYDQLWHACFQWENSMTGQRGPEKYERVTKEAALEIANTL